MPTIHPAFDPLTRTWFVDNYEAPTLAALKKLLPPRTKIKDYHPNGYTTIRPNTPTQRVYLPTKSSFHFQSPTKHKSPTPIKQKPIHRVESKPRSATAPPSQKKYNHDAVLDLWAKGITGPEIGQRLGLHSSTTAAQIVGYYYGKDPRAIRRAPARTTFHEQPNSLAKSSFFSDD